MTRINENDVLHSVVRDILIFFDEKFCDKTLQKSFADFKVYFIFKVDYFMSLKFRISAS